MKSTPVIWEPITSAFKEMLKQLLHSFAQIQLYNDKHYFLPLTKMFSEKLPDFQFYSRKRTLVVWHKRMISQILANIVRSVLN